MGKSETYGISKMDCFLHNWCDNSAELVIWRDTGFAGIKYYYAEGGLYVLRSGAPGANCVFGFVKAGSPFEAAELWIKN